MTSTKNLFDINEPMSITDNNYYSCDLLPGIDKFNNSYFKEFNYSTKDYKIDLVQQELINIIEQIMLDANVFRTKCELNRVLTTIYDDMTTKNIPTDKTTLEELFYFIKNHIKQYITEENLDNVVNSIIDGIKTSKSKILALHTVNQSSNNIVDSILSNSKLQDTNIIVLEPNKVSNNIHKHINDMTNSPHIKSAYKRMNSDNKIDYINIHNFIKDNLISGINKNIKSKLPEHFSSNTHTQNINIVDNNYNPIDMNSLINDKLDNNLNVINVAVQTHETQDPIDLHISKSDDNVTTLKIETFNAYNADKDALISDIIDNIEVDRINLESAPNNSIIIEIKVPDNTDLAKMSNIIINKLNNNRNRYSSCIYPIKQVGGNFDHYNNMRNKNNMIFMIIFILLFLLTIKY